jgi:hypothetical protein
MTEVLRLPADVVEFIRDARITLSDTTELLARRQHVKPVPLPKPSTPVKR